MRAYFQYLSVAIVVGQADFDRTHASEDTRDCSPVGAPSSSAIAHFLANLEIRIPQRRGRLCSQNGRERH